MMALELVESGSKSPNSSMAVAVQKACMERGVLTLTCGTFGNNIRLLPPLTIPEDLLREALGILAEGIAAG